MKAKHYTGNGPATTLVSKVGRRAIFIALAASAFFVLPAGAQGMAQVREGLARPSVFSGAAVRVTEHQEAVPAIQIADKNGRQGKITSYRVSLFRDNSQYAQANARAVAGKFKELYPDVAVSVEYESPYFSVEAGNFVDHTAAVALCGKAMSSFPKAVVMRSETAVSAIIARQKPNLADQKPDDFAPPSEISEKNADNLVGN